MTDPRTYGLTDAAAVDALVDGRHGDPFALLGPHLVEGGGEGIHAEALPQPPEPRPPRHPPGLPRDDGVEHAALDVRDEVAELARASPGTVRHCRSPVGCAP